MTAPSFWQVLVLAGGVLRLWRLIAADDILGKPRDWLLDRAPRWVDRMVACPYCLGLWLTGGVWGCWQVWPTPTMAIAALGAVSMIVGVLGDMTVE